MGVEEGACPLMRSFFQARTQVIVMCDDTTYEVPRLFGRDIRIVSRREERLRSLRVEPVRVFGRAIEREQPAFLR